MITYYLMIVWFHRHVLFANRAVLLLRTCVLCNSLPKHVAVTIYIIQILLCSMEGNRNRDSIYRLLYVAADKDRPCSIGVNSLFILFFFSVGMGYYKNYLRKVD